MTGDPDIYRAISFYSGGRFEPSPDIKWDRLDDRIRASKYDAYQFCWYMTCFSGMEASWVVLRRKEVMCHMKYWERFLTWKSTRARDVGKIVANALEMIDALNNSGVSLTRILLNDVPSFNAIVRIERALRERHNTEGEYDISPVLKKWRVRAMEKLLGDPEYLIWCPHLHIEAENRGAVYRELIPA